MRWSISSMRSRIEPSSSLAPPSLLFCSGAGAASDTFEVLFAFWATRATLVFVLRFMFASQRTHGEHAFDTSQLFGDRLRHSAVDVDQRVRQLAARFVEQVGDVELG